MGILDDAIREHLDLKRKHGAREVELHEIEDEAFGSSDQPDPFVAGELFNEMSGSGAAQRSSAGAAAAEIADRPAPGVGGEEPTRLVEPEGLRRDPEAPDRGESPAREPAADEARDGSLEEPVSPPEGVTPIPGQTELPQAPEIPGQERLDQPFESRRPTEAEPEPRSPSESLEELIAEEEPFPEDTAAPPPASAEAVEAPQPASEAMGPQPESEEMTTPPRLEEMAPPPESEEMTAPPESEEMTAHPQPESSVPEPPPPPPPPRPEPPGRARGRVDVPTQEHPPPGETGGVPAVPPREAGHETEPPPEPALEPAPEPEPVESAGPALYDFESDEEPLAGGPSEEPPDEFEALGPADEEAPHADEGEPYAEEPASGAEAPLDEPGTEVRPALEDTETYEGGGRDPEEAYEEDEGDEGLWFEKGPPKDFDFD